MGVRVRVRVRVGVTIRVRTEVEVMVAAVPEWLTSALASPCTRIVDVTSAHPAQAARTPVREEAMERENSEEGAKGRP